MSASSVAGSRCPSCGARVAPGDAWCSLCHGSLRPAPEPLAPVAPVRVAGPAAPARSEDEAARAAAAADRMLAELAAGGDGVTSLHRAVVRRTGDAHRVVLSLGLGVAALLLVVCGLTLLGVLL